MREIFHGTRGGDSEYPRSWAGQRERDLRRARCSVEERLSIRRLSVPSALLSKFADNNSTHATEYFNYRTP
jgi:hypothetical protein